MTRETATPTMTVKRSLFQRPCAKMQDPPGECGHLDPIVDAMAYHPNGPELIA